MQRSDGRNQSEMRPLRVVYDIYEHAAASVLYEIGKTKVLCSISLQPGVPQFLRGCKTGWLTAHYAMLPAATPKRVEREINLGKKNERYVEISRLIGRSLRSVLQLELLPDQTIVIDCDVLQADGGTRTASITGSFLALKQAERRWLTQGIIKQEIIKHDVAAISVGIFHGMPILDPSFVEDSSAEGDFNFVITRSGLIIEIQGTAEKEPLAVDIFHKAHDLAHQGIQHIFSHFENKALQKKKPGLFALSERLKKIPHPTENL